MAEGFAAFILTHGRPDKVITYRTLRAQGYTGPIYLIVDNEDKTVAQYRANYGDQVIVFDKEAIARSIDEGDNFRDRRAVIYARNASFQIARDLGLEYFVQLDDDYTDFRFKFTSGYEYRHRLLVKDLDRLFAIILAFYESVPALSVAMGQGGDVIGGAQSGTGARLWLKRKAMNSFFCATSRPFQFFGRINEDVNTYVKLGNCGALFMTFFNCALQQLATQHNRGGMTGIYESLGTYIKSFYTVMYNPSCVNVRATGTNHPRLHHRITWDNAVPKIVSESLRRS